MAYESEMEQIRSRYGGLEQIRSRLGMSRRQICEFLLVDPSAWTRWVRDEKETAPPHVYRTLSLLLDRLSHEPGFLSTGSAPVQEIHRLDWQEKTLALDEEVRSRLETLKTQVVAQAELTLGWKLLLLLNVVLVLYVLFR